MKLFDHIANMASLALKGLRWADLRTHSLLQVSHPRSNQVVRSVVGLVAVKFIAVVTNFFLVPITLTYLNPSRFGVWTTLTALIGWISILDIGLGSGLRNALAEAIAKSDFMRARILVSTTYIYVGGVGIFGACILLLINSWIDWSSILNAPMSQILSFERFLDFSLSRSL